MVSAHPVWFVISGAFFLVSVLLDLVLITVAVRVGRRLDAVLEGVHTTTFQVGERAIAIASSAESIATAAQDIAGEARDRTRDVLARAEDESARITSRLAACGTGIAAVFLAVRIAGAVRGVLGETERHPPLPSSGRFRGA